VSDDGLAQVRGQGSGRISPPPPGSSLSVLQVALVPPRLERLHQVEGYTLASPRQVVGQHRVVLAQQIAHQEVDGIGVQAGQGVAGEGTGSIQGLEGAPGGGIGPQFGAAAGEQKEHAAFHQTREQKRQKGESFGVGPLEVLQHPEVGRDAGQAQDEDDEGLLEPLTSLGRGEVGKRALVGQGLGQGREKRRGSLEMNGIHQASQLADAQGGQGRRQCSQQQGIRG